MRTRTSLSVCTVLFFAALLALPGICMAQEDECLNCHGALDDAPSSAFMSDVHKKAGLTCASCHGGNPRSDDMEASMSKAKGFIGVPKGMAISKTCGSCHDDAKKMAGYGYKGGTGQLTELLNSAHAHGKGDKAEALMQCSDCHGAHGIRSPDDPASKVARRKVVNLCSTCHSSPEYMRRFNPSLATDQLAKYRTSLHGQRDLAGDPNVANCADCHSAHNIRPSSEANSTVHPLNIPATCGSCHSDKTRMAKYNLPTDQLEKFKGSVHGVALLEKHEASAPSCNDCHGNHGAVPPNVESISNVCGTCHALNADLFSESRHSEEFDRLGYPECETCHGNHDVQPATVDLLRLDEGSLCGKCHSDTKAPEGFRAARGMRSLLDSLVETIDLAEKRVDAAEQKGMEVDDIRFALRDARQARFQSRTAVHSFDLAKFREVVDPGLGIARLALSDAEGANDEYYYRRHGLAVATLIITLTVVLLFIYIRRLDRKDGSEGSAPPGGAAA